jgi:hypothetical protein
MYALQLGCDLFQHESQFRDVRRAWDLSASFGNRSFSKPFNQPLHLRASVHLFASFLMAKKARRDLSLKSLGTPTGRRLAPSIPPR